MIRTLILTTLLCLSAGQLFADDATEQEMRKSIGKTYWLAKPRNKGLEICAQSMKKCRLYSDVSLTVIGVAKAPGFPDYKVRMQDGFLGYLSYVDRDRLSDHDLHPLVRRQLQLCEESGRPDLGSSRDLVVLCLGSPSRIVTTETAGGASELLYYSGRANVYLVGNIVTAVQSIR